ncbi:MAG: hypothetical protein GXY34_11270 [Syntrophomonadaceae bacterium]|nr:hypothetical protein [Syntrophomonadaceae bacterium]
MESKAEYKARLKTELRQVGSEIEQLITKTDQIAAEIKQGYEEIETDLLDKQSETLAKLNESSLSKDEVWALIWDNVSEAVKEFNLQAITKVRQDYKELEPALQARQAALQKQFHESAIEAWAEIWNAVWYEVWNIAEELNRRAAIEIKQISEEFEALFVKQAELQAKLHELLVAGDEAWTVLKEVGNAIVKGRSS